MNLTSVILYTVIRNLFFFTTWDGAWMSPRMRSAFVLRTNTFHVQGKNVTGYFGFVHKPTGADPEKYATPFLLISAIA